MPARTILKTTRAVVGCNTLLIGPWDSGFDPNKEGTCKVSPHLSSAQCDLRVAFRQGKSVRNLIYFTAAPSGQYTRLLGFEIADMTPRTDRLSDHSREGI